MWKKIITLKEIQNIKVNDLILQHPTNDQKGIENPTGQENNSEFYEVTTVTADGIKLNYLSQSNSFGGLTINSMVRELSYSDLITGIWWKR
jgi:hypothetical protein